MNNCDKNETQKFEAMANEWWDPNGVCKPLHVLNPLRLQFITDRIDIEDKQIVDIGCGAGILSESMALRGAEVLGLDAAPILIEAAEQHYQQMTSVTSSDTNMNHKKLKLTYQVGTAEEFAEENASQFDIVTCMELLEHVPDPESLINACAKLIKPGGTLFLSTINRDPKSFLFAILGAEYLFKILPKHTHEYAKFIRPSELALCLRGADFNLTEIKGMDYNPLLHRAKLTKDVSVNYIIQATRN